jgi:hypothetical protein
MTCHLSPHSRMHTTQLTRTARHRSEVSKLKLVTRVVSEPKRLMHEIESRDQQRWQELYSAPAPDRARLAALHARLQAVRSTASSLSASSSNLAASAAAGATDATGKRSAPDASAAARTASPQRRGLGAGLGVAPPTPPRIDPSGGMTEGALARVRGSELRTEREQGTANAILGGRRKRPAPSSVATAASTGAATSTNAAATASVTSDPMDAVDSSDSAAAAAAADATLLKPRHKRITLADLVFFMQTDRRTSKSDLLYKTMLKYGL